MLKGGEKVVYEVSMAEHAQPIQTFAVGGKTPQCCHGEATMSSCNMSAIS